MNQGHKIRYLVLNRVVKRLLLEWIPQNQVRHFMFTQRYTLHHAILYLGEFIGHENC